MRLTKCALPIFLFLTGCGSPPFYSFDEGYATSGASDAAPAPPATGSAGLGSAIAVDAGPDTPTKHDAGVTHDSRPVVTGSGGALGAGGTPGAGGAPVVGSTGGSAPATDACVETTHDNGAGQQWRDCVPRGTHDELQARKACEAWCAGGRCESPNVNPSPCWTSIVCGEPTMIGQLKGIDPNGLRGWSWGTGVTWAIKFDQSSCAATGTWN